MRQCSCVVVYTSGWLVVRMSVLSCSADGVSTVCSASPRGHVAVWDLEQRRLAAIMREAHDGAVCGLHFLPSQPVLLTSSPDNQLVVYTLPLDIQMYMYFSGCYTCICRGNFIFPNFCFIGIFPELRYILSVIHSYPMTVELLPLV